MEEHGMGDNVSSTGLGSSIVHQVKKKPFPENLVIKLALNVAYTCWI